MSLFESISNYKNNIAIINKSTGPLTYESIIKKEKIIQKHIPERSLIFLITQNTVAPLISYISAIRNNCVVMLIDIKTNISDVLNLINSYKPSFIFAPASWINTSKLEKYAVLESIYDYYICKTNYQKHTEMNDNLCVLLPTSGSMGSPKFVRLSKENLKTNADSIINYLEIDSNERAVTTMPYSYSYMLSIINTHIEVGASILVSNNSLIQKEFWNEFRENNITSFSGVPYIFETIIKLGIEKIYIPSLRSFTQAGGKLSNESIKKILKFCEKKNIRFTIMYGQTEASPRMTYLSWKDSSKKIGSIGKAIPFTKIWLKNNDGQKIKKSNEIGELIFEGKNVSMGYSNSVEDLKKGDENKGILKTGDLACFDDEGYFYIKGRKTRMVKIFGNRFNLDEIEERMKKYGIEIACKDSGDKLLVFFQNLYLKKNILEKICQITGQNKIAFTCISLKKFPRTSSGKIDYLKLQDNRLNA